MQTDLRDLLMGYPPLASQIGRMINWGASPQSYAATHVVMTMVSDQEGMTMQGPDGLRRGRVQVDCYAPTYAAAAAVADAVRACLSGYRGGRFHGIFFAGSRDLRDTGDDAADIYRVSLDFMTNWRDDIG